MLNRQRLAQSWLGGLLLLMTAAASPGDVETDLLRKETAAQIPLTKIAEPLRGHVEDVLKNASLYVRGPTEAFPCRPGIYRWALDHPDWIIGGWKALAQTPITIDRQADGSFLGKDNQGGTLRWQCILSEPGRRVWYAEGSGRMAPFLPVVSMRAVLCLKHQDVIGDDGRLGVRHRTEVFALYDAKSAGWFSLLVGVSPDTAGKKVLDQIEIFFSGMAYYLSEHPEWAKKTFEPKAVTADDKLKYDALSQELAKAGRGKPFPMRVRP